MKAIGLLIILMVNSTAGETKKISINIHHNCNYFPDQPIEDEVERQICCYLENLRFMNNWMSSDFYLSTFFMKLTSWRCTKQLKYQCTRRPYAFNKFTSTMYDRFCTPETFKDNCFEKISDMLKENDQPTRRSIAEDLITFNIDTNEGSAISSIQPNNMGPLDGMRELIEGLSSRDFTHEQIQDPCVSVALFDSKLSGGFGSYHEVSSVLMPFCDIVWCGYDSHSIFDRHISVWTCMAKSCRNGIIAEAVFAAILAFAVVVTNIMVLVTFSMSPKLKNSQVVYKKSLAIADLLVGLIVLPTFIKTMLNWTHTPHKPTHEFVPLVNAPHDNNKSIYQSFGSLNEKQDPIYLNAIGFFTACSVLGSVYTLAMAGFDRLWAISRPLNYSRHNSIKVATITVVLLWFVAIMFSCLPFILGERLSYSVVAAAIIGMSGTTAVVLYSVALILPIVVCWFTSIAVYISTKRHSVERAKMVTSTRSATKQAYKMEKRLAGTLSLMVGVFTLCILPSVVVMCVSMGLGSIVYNDPDSFEMNASKAYVSSEYICGLILMSNSLWNFFIYSGRNQDFRTAARILAFKAGAFIGIKMPQESQRYPLAMPSNSQNGHINHAFDNNNSLPRTIDQTSAGYLSASNTPNMKRKNVPFTSINQV